MSSHIRVSLATAADVEAMARFSTEDSETDLDLIERLWWEEGPNTSILKFQLSRLSLTHNVEDSRTRVFKATSKGSKKVNGFAILAFKDGQISDLKPTSSIQGMNHELTKVYWTLVTTKRRMHLDGQRHVVWAGPRVSKAARNQGIDIALMQWAFTHFGLEKETIWAVTPAAGVQVFAEHGFEKADVIDFDLSDWAGEGSGSKMVQLSCMLRRPGELRTQSSGLAEKW